ncbi:multisubunit potassium/proton antiporter PhaE subunit [Stella humosa]|uniref:Multisubunit potassium/proton antiporter PhaE subunit n=1 Tax=Stella humosa TaxID=94 RepID=A0A3N1KYD6_9PROT|nr:Na+/H+ antiporter subunit E [Stella humosa]ROP84167.1 multisubunit potassium/proton antiporter PhaE subunit [Stella humosa]BBK33677.1 Na+/H+ antiporter subunit E [Stella humosa]
MTRWLPSPLASLLLMALWLLLNQSVSPGHLLLGAVLGVIGPHLMTRLDTPAMRIGRPWAIVRLIGIFVVDVVRSNINVARVILQNDRRQTSGFARIRLRMRSPYGLAALACMLTAAPGTCWVSYDPAAGTLVIHVLDLVDSDDWEAIIERRYERLLMEIFE